MSSGRGDNRKLLTDAAKDVDDRFGVPGEDGPVGRPRSQEVGQCEEPCPKSAALRPQIVLEKTQVLQPYSNTGTTLWDDERSINFKVTIKEPTAHTWIHARDDSKVIRTYKTTTTLNKPGTHDWRWDGFDDSFVLDTEVLKRNRLSADVLTDSGRSPFEELETQQIRITWNPLEPRWMDLRIDDPAKKIDVKVYVTFQNSPVPDKALDSATFSRLKGLILAGIGKYWSRPRVLIRWRYDVTTTAIERSTDAVEFFLTKPMPASNIPGLPPYLAILADENGIGERCFNPGVSVGTDNLPIIFFYDGGADDWVKETAAHEFGHAVLLKGIAADVSLTHKGTSTPGQKTIPGAYSYPAAPAEIDLMKYSKDSKPADFYSRVVATEDDVKALLSLARIEFKRK